MIQMEAIPAKRLELTQALTSLVLSIRMEKGCPYCEFGQSMEGFSIEYVDDTVITTKVKSQLAADDFLKSFQISVETYNGTVQLSGFVDSQDAVNKAVSITRGVQGVKSVKNDLIVK